MRYLMEKVKIEQVALRSKEKIYWRSRENPLGFSHGMKDQNLLPICAQIGILAKLALEKPI